MGARKVVTSCIIFCDFCGKDQNEVTAIVAGPKVRGEAIHICNESIALCETVIAKNLGAEKKEKAN